MPPEPDLDSALRRVLRPSLPDPAPHPAPEELAAYHEDRLPEEREEALRDHLVACRECAEWVLELAALADAGEADAGEEEERGSSAMDLARAWRRHRQLLRRARRLTATARAPAALRRAWAAAAALALVSLGLGLWAGIQRQRLVLLDRPQVNPPLLNLEPVGASRAPQEAWPALELGSRAPSVWLLLHPAADLHFDTYRVELVAEDGGRRWAREGLQPSEAESFRLQLPAKLLPPGRYRILLSGRSRDRGYETMEEYLLEVHHG